LFKRNHPEGMHLNQLWSIAAHGLLEGTLVWLPLTARRRNFERHHQRRLNRNCGLRHHWTPLVAPRRHYGLGAGLRRRHNHGHHCGDRWVQREAAATMAEAVHEAVADATKVAAIHKAVAISPLVAAPEREDKASASNISADVDDLLPPPPAFTVPPMEWLLGGPSARWLVDEPERNFSDEEDEANISNSKFRHIGISKYCTIISLTSKKQIK
jgi:hypothetical protein